MSVTCEFVDQTELIPIQLGISTPRPINVLYWILLDQKAQQNFKYKILDRDFYTCRFCGFRSNKYQQIVVRQGHYWHWSDCVTSCIYCAQCLMLEQVSSMRSGVLIYAPEFSQAQLHQLARIIYVCRISQGTAADKARASLDLLIHRRKQANNVLGSDDPKFLTEQLQACCHTDDYLAIINRITDIRLFPLDRRIIKEADLEFNQFPQILAYWRSKAGPLSMKPAEMDLTPLDNLLTTLG